MSWTSKLERFGPWPYVLFTGIVFGAGGLLAKGLVDDDVDPFAVTALPFLAGGAIGLLVSLGRRQLRFDALPSAALLGVAASAGPALLFNLGFERLSAGIVTLLISLGPVFTAVVSHFVYHDEAFNKVKAVGLALAISGVAILASGTLDGTGSALGLVFVISGALMAGLGAVPTRTISRRHGPMSLIGPQLAFAGVAAAALSFVVGRDLRPPEGFEAWHVVSMIGFGVTTYLGFLSILRANQLGTTGQVSVLAYFVPLFGVVGGVLVFDDPVTFSLVGGGLLIVAAVGVIAAGSSPTADVP